MQTHAEPRAFAQTPLGAHIAAVAGCSPDQAGRVVNFYVDEGAAVIDPITGTPKARRREFLERRTLLNAIAVVEGGR